MWFFFELRGQGAGVGQGRVVIVDSKEEKQTIAWLASSGLVSEG